MAFNNTRTILLHGPRGMEWYCPTPARPPWETDKRHPMEQFRDRQFAAMPFPYSQPTILGALATPAGKHAGPGATSKPRTIPA